MKSRYVGKCQQCSTVMMHNDIGVCPGCGHKQDMGRLPTYETKLERFKQSQIRAAGLGQTLNKWTSGN